MPLYEYPCMDCGETDQWVAGTDDHVAICVNCRGVILRVDMDIWAPLMEGAVATTGVGAVKKRYEYWDRDDPGPLVHRHGSRAGFGYGYPAVPVWGVLKCGEGGDLNPLPAPGRARHVSLLVRRNQRAGSSL